MIADKTARFIFESSDGHVRCSLERNSGIERIGAPRPFEKPLSDAELTELAWYFDVYPMTATGSGHFRASQVEARLRTWGRRLFDLLFPVDSPVRTAWNDSVGADRSVWLVGGEEGFLSLPWELAQSSDAERPLGQWARLTRFPATPNRLDRVELPAPRRALVVISRPDATPAISYLLFARDLLAYLGQGGAGVDVEVLRPPTFEAFKIRLQAARDEGRPYDIIHFDGHGGISRSKDGARVAHLTFESPGGSARHIDTEAFGAALGNSAIPLVVLAACHSGDLAGAEGSIAASLVRTGSARAVVAMSHAVCTDAAQAFLSEFYRGVVTGRPLGQAVCDGRLRLADSSVRAREHGEVHLQDWAVPVLYSDAAVAFTGQHIRPVEAVSSALGRDASYFELERILRRTRSVGILGLAGSGKTTFAYDAANWLSATTPGHAPVARVDATGSDGPDDLARRTGEALGFPDSSLEAVLARATGPIVLDGLDVARWREAERYSLAIALTNRPSDAAPVIVTGRGQALSEAGLASISIPPLSPEVIRGLLPDVFRQDIRAVDFVDGHAATARHAGPVRADEQFPVYLDATALAPVRFALNMLPKGSERQLRLIAGHGPRLEFQSLKHLTNYFAREAGLSVPIADLDGLERGTYESWGELVEACINVGLAERIDGDIYRLHPGLGPALVDAWRHEVGDEFARQWSALEGAADQAFLSTASQLSMFMAIGAGLGDREMPTGLRLIDTRYVRAQLSVLEARIRDAVIRAVERGESGFAGLAAQALAMLWGETGRREIGFCETIIKRLADRPNGQNDDGGILQYVMLQQIALHRGSSSVDVVAMVRALLDRQEMNELEVRPSRGDWLLVLAIALDVRGRAAEAEPLARQAIEALLRQNDPDAVRRAEYSLALIMNNLGRGGAARWRSDSTEVGLTPADYIEAINQQAVRAFDQGDVKRAMDLQLQNLKAADANPRQRARAMHELGLLCLKQGRHEDAERWFLQSLAIKESKLEPGEGVRTYQMLASVALDSDRLDEAAGWFEKALEFADRFDYTAAPSAQFGLAEIARRRGEHELALDQVVAGFARFVHMGLPESGTELGFAKTVLEDTSASDLEVAWARVQGQAIASAERVGLSECLGRLGLHALAGAFSAPARDATESTVVARALLLQATAISARAGSQSWTRADGDEAGRVLDEAVRRLRAEESLPRPLLRTLGEALLGRAAFLCASGDKVTGVSVAREAAELMEVFREGPEIDCLMDYARAHGLVGLVCRDLGRWNEAATAYAVEAEAYRLCSAANDGFRPRRFEALEHSISAHLRADMPQAALDLCAVLREEMDRAYPGAAACGAEPPMGVVIQHTHDALSRLGDAGDARKVIADRLEELEKWVEQGSPGVFREFASWTVWLLTYTEEHDERLARRLAEVATRGTVDEFDPRYSSALAHAGWERLQAGRPDAAEAIRSALASLESQAPERIDLRVALARIDFDRTLGRGKPTTPQEDEAIASRLETGILAADDKASPLSDPSSLFHASSRYGFAMEHAVGKRLGAGEHARALALADEFEALILPRPEILPHALASLVGCRRNLIVVYLQGQDVRGAVDQVRRVLAAAIQSGDAVRFGEVEHDAAPTGKTHENAGPTIMEIVQRAVGRLVEGGPATVTLAKELLNELITAAAAHPENDLVGAMALSACSNLLLRTEINADEVKLLQERATTAVAARRQPGLIGRTLPLIYMASVFAERRRGNLASARICLAEMIGATRGVTMGQMIIAYAGLGLARDLAQKGENAAFIIVVRQIIEGIQGCKELEPLLNDLAGASDHAISVGHELREVEGPYHIIEGLRSLLPLYPQSVELRQTVAIAITNVIGLISASFTLEGWVSDLFSLCSGEPAFPQQAEVLVIGTANALVSLETAGLGELGDQLTHDAVAASGSKSGEAWPAELAPILDSRLTALRQRDDLKAAVDTIIGAVAADGREDAVAVSAARHLSAFAGQAWAQSGALERARLGEAIRRLLKRRPSRTIVESALDRSLLEQLRSA